VVRPQEESPRDEKSVGSQNLPKVPMFRAKNLVDGRDISLEDFEGHVLIIDFWATWCPPCRAEIPGFIELHNKYKDREFAFIGMSMDVGGEALVKRFIEQNNMNYPVVIAGEKIQEDYEKAMGRPITGIPTTLVVNREGGIVSIHVGFKPKDVFEKEILKLL
jgi:cytochrome c biogenesis protein CcmG/thiol:disulfide interchange protein DsbE